MTLLDMCFEGMGQCERQFGVLALLEMCFKGMGRLKRVFGVLTLPEMCFEHTFCFDDVCLPHPFLVYFRHTKSSPSLPKNRGFYKLTRVVQLDSTSRPGASKGGILALRTHCALLLDYVPPEEPLGTPLGDTLRIRRPKMDWRGP